MKILKGGPHVTTYFNNIVWFDNYGEFHRVDGPAYIYSDGSNDLRWYIHGKYIPKNQVKEWREQNGIEEVPFTKEQSMLYLLTFG